MSKNAPMIYNFEVLKERVIDTLKLTDLNKELKHIKGNTICVGSGGSNVVAAFASIVLNVKNKCCTKVEEPRDVLYENLNNYKNLFICSYSGNNHGVNILSSLKMKKYLLTYGNNENSFKILKCNSSIDKEMSFISLGATLMPMSILFKYYVNDKVYDYIDEMLSNIKDYDIDTISYEYDILSGSDTIAAERYLESTFTESGLGSVIVHKKYDYCHGRSTIAYTKKRNLIYLVSNRKELDDLLLDNLKDRYLNVIVLESNYNDIVIDNFNLTIQAMYLTKQIASKKELDLSIVNYDKELCKILYKYKGEM